MIKVEEIEAIRRKYFLEGWSIREINRELKHCRQTIRKAILRAEPRPYQLQTSRAMPEIGPYQTRIEELLENNKELPRKQGYTARRISQEIQKEGYPGSEGSVRRYVAAVRKETQKKDAYLPLEFDPGIDAQVDWGEAVIELAGKRTTAHIFVMRLNYSRARFAMAFPFERQEAFLEGHIQAFTILAG
jgi:transposase